MEEKKPLSVRWDNFKYALWEYYRWPIIVGVTVIVILGGVIYSFLNRQDIAFYVIAVNGNLVKGDALAEEFRQYDQINPEDRMVIADGVMNLEKYEQTTATIDMLFATSTTKELDAVILDSMAFASLADQALYTDLGQLLTAGELKALGDRVYYLDRDDLTDVVTEAPPPVELSNDPTALEDPVPVAVELTGSGKIEKYSLYREGDCFFAVAEGSQRKDRAIRFMWYLMEQ